MIFLGIDGTGPSNDGDYHRGMANSFIRRMYARLERLGSSRFYHRGPNLPSMGGSWSGGLFTISQTHDLALTGLSWLKSRFAAGDAGPIVLAGYSRGGAAVIELARLLASEGTGRLVDVMVLFDAVDRDIRVDTRLITPNVKKVYHAIRDDAIGSRWYFSHTGTMGAFPGQLVTKTIRGTHAALGGMPWSGDYPQHCEPDWSTTVDRGTTMKTQMRCVPAITEAEDRGAEIKTWEFMVDSLRNHGIQP